MMKTSAIYETTDAKTKKENNNRVTTLEGSQVERVWNISGIFQDEVSRSMPKF